MNMKWQYYNDLKDRAWNEYDVVVADFDDSQTRYQIRLHEHWMMMVGCRVRLSVSFSDSSY